MAAHEHQLSDLSETCERERDLLSCLKESRVNPSEYLARIEHMLNRKASSIQGLQAKITMLKAHERFAPRFS